MTAAEYLTGLTMLVAVAAALAVTSWSVRRLVLPDWSGPPARLAELVLGIATLVLASEAVGSFGGFRRWPLVVTCIGIAAASAAAARRWGPPAANPRDSIRADTAESTVAAGLAVLALAPWVEKVVDAFREGMREYDTLWYHLPFAARFAREGWLTRLHNVDNPATSFFPANAEVFHAVGILLLGADVLSPLLNLAWFGVALLAGWCLGRVVGVAPAAAAAVALVFALPVVVDSQAASAKNDVAGLALLLAAAALLATAPRRPAVLAIAALAAGLAVGTKVSFIAPAVALAVGAIAVQSRADRLRATGLWLGGILVGSAYWYARNAAHTRNPLPWFDVSFAGLSLPSAPPPIDCGTTSVAEYATDLGALRDDIFPFVSVALGSGWPLVLMLAAVGVAASFVRRRRVATLLAGVAVVTAAAYLVTPATAGGEDARCFYYNTRVVTPALVLGLALLPIAVAGRGRVAVRAVIALVALAVAVTAAPSWREVVLAAAAAAAAWAAATLRVPRGAAAGIAAAFVVAVSAAGWIVQDRYLERRYSAGELPDPIGPSYAALRDTDGVRVAAAGFFAHYPLYGVTSSNDVEFPAHNRDGIFRPIRTCGAWQEALRQGNFEYVVTAGAGGGAEPDQARWTRRDPAATQLLHVDGNRLFRFDPNGAPPRCR